MVKPLVLSFFAALACANAVCTQTRGPGLQPQLSPRTAYADAMQPLTAARRRYARSVPSAFQPGNTIDTAIACVGAYWPLQTAPTQQANSTSARHRKTPAANR